MITIRKAAESDAQDIFDIRSRAIVEKCFGLLLRRTAVNMDAGVECLMDS